MKHNEIEILKAQLQQVSGLDKVSLLQDLAVAAISEQPEVSLEFAKEALELGHQAGAEQEVVASIHEQIGQACLRLNRFEQALENFIEALVIWQELNEAERSGQNFMDIAGIYYDLGDFDQALDYYYDALTIWRETDDQASTSHALNNLGNVYWSIKDYRNALKYYTDALGIKEQTGDLASMISSLNNIGNVHMELNDSKMALEYFNEALQLKEELDDTAGQAVLLNNIGLIHYETGELDTALDYFQRAMEIVEREEDASHLAVVSINLGRLHLVQGNLDLSQTFLETGLENARTLHSKQLQRDCYELLSELYTERDDCRQAFDYYRQYTRLKDQIIDQERSRKIAELETIYEKEKKEREAKAYKAKSVELAQMNQRLTAAYKTIEEKSIQMELAFRKLEQSEAALQESNTAKDKFFSILAHDIKNPLSGLVLSSSLLMEYHSRMTPGDIKGSAERIHRAAKQLSTLIGNLLEWSRSQTGTLQYAPAVYDLKELVSDTVAVVTSMADSKKIQLINEVHTSMEVFVDDHMISTVLRNLISNAIKFTREGGHVKVSVDVDRDSEVVVTVSDDGVGMEPEVIQNKLFRLEVHHTTQGTAREKGTGLGLILCKEFIEKNGGQIWAESDPGVGSAFKFTLPYKPSGNGSKTTPASDLPGSSGTDHA